MPSLAMEPTIPAGSKVTVDFAAYKSREPCRSEIVVFRPPAPTNALFVFRVVGLTGEAIKITDARVLINGKSLTVPGGVRYMPVPSGINQTNLSTTEFFLLGDNTSQARDSRYLGPIKRGDILGKVINIEPPVATSPGTSP